MTGHAPLLDQAREEARALAGLLEGAGLTVALAESCTGGLLGWILTSVPGISSRFGLGVVAYADSAKADLLGVPRSMLRAHGAVSEPVAQAMAEGAARRAGANLGLGVTGIAGPSGGGPGKPVGLVYVAAHLDGRGHVRREAFGPRGRETVRLLSALAALRLGTQTVRTLRPRDRSRRLRPAE